MGASGGALGTTAAVKYATSQSDSKQEQNNQITNNEGESNVVETIIKNNTKATGIEEVKKNFSDWSQTSASKNCTIKVKLSADDEETTIDQIQDESILNGLYMAIIVPVGKGNGITDKCKSAGENKTVVATKGLNENTWTFDGPK